MKNSLQVKQILAELNTAILCQVSAQAGLKRLREIDLSLEIK